MQGGAGKTSHVCTWAIWKISTSQQGSQKKAEPDTSHVSLVDLTSVVLQSLKATWKIPQDFPSYFCILQYTKITWEITRVQKCQAIVGYTCLPRHNDPIYMYGIKSRMKDNGSFKDIGPFTINDVASTNIAPFATNAGGIITHLQTKIWYFSPIYWILYDGFHYL